MCTQEIFVFYVLYCILIIQHKPLLPIATFLQIGTRDVSIEILLRYWDAQNTVVSIFTFINSRILQLQNM